MVEQGIFLQGRARALGKVQAPQQRGSDHHSSEARGQARTLALAPPPGEQGRSRRVREQVLEEG